MGSSGMIRKFELVFLVILLLLTVCLFLINALVGGSVAGPERLADDLVSPPGSPQDWNVQTHIPAKYRLLFKWIVKGTWSVLFPESGAMGFYRIYVFWSFLFFYAAFVAFYFFLKGLDFSKTASFVGCLLFLASPPVLMAYRFPVHTREDPLGYLLIVLGLIAVFKSKPLMVVLISVLGGFTRETTLMVPFVYFVALAEPMRKKLLVCAPPVLVVVLIWLLSGKSYTYNPLAVRTVRYPLETVASIFLVFGFLWIPGLLELRAMRRSKRLRNEAWRILATTAPVVLLIVLGISLFLTRVREMRISFVLFPWMIPLALEWFRVQLPRLRRLAGGWVYWLYVFVVVSLLTFAFAYTPSSFPRFMWHLRAFRSITWFGVGYVHLLLTCIVVLPLLKRNDARLSAVEGG
jgi:hypothetical protein